MVLYLFWVYFIVFFCILLLCRKLGIAKNYALFGVKVFNLKLGWCKENDIFHILTLPLTQFRYNRAQAPSTIWQIINIPLGTAHVNREGKKQQYTSCYTAQNMANNSTHDMQLCNTHVETIICRTSKEYFQDYNID